MQVCPPLSPHFFFQNHSVTGPLSNRAIWQENPHFFPKNELPSYSPKTATTGLRRHLTKKHELDYTRACKDFGWDAHRDPDPDAGPLSGPAKELKEREPFTSEALLRYIVNFVVADDQVRISSCLCVSSLYVILISSYKSINVVECPEFRQLLLFLREDLREEDIARRDKIRDAIMRAWYAYYKVLKDELQVSSVQDFFIRIYSENYQCNLKSALGRISYTSDTWSSGNLQSFYAMTAHWAYRDESDDTIKMKVRLIAFHRIKGRHTAENMAKITVDLLGRAGVTDNVSYI